MSRFKLSSITKAMTEAINAAPDVDALSKSLGAPPLAPRIVAEYGSLHSATCVDYDPVQRLLAVGVDTGVKVLGADGLSVLLATPRHLEPALRVRFVSSVGRVIRVSVESGVDVWDLRSQTLLASTRWPNEVTAVAALRRSPFIMLGEASGVVRVAAARPGADGGVLAPRAYAVTPDQAMGVVPWELRSVEELTSSEEVLEASAGKTFRESGSNSACVAVEPQPGFETARVLFAYADGRLAVWDLHAKKPAATGTTPETKTKTKTAKNGEGVSLRCATWVGNGGGVIATGHDDGAVRLRIVPALGKPGSARRHAVAIACARAFHPRAGASADERMPVRASRRAPWAPRAPDGGPRACRPPRERVERLRGRRRRLAVRRRFGVRGRRSRRRARPRRFSASGAGRRVRPAAARGGAQSRRGGLAVLRAGHGCGAGVASVPAGDRGGGGDALGGRADPRPRRASARARRPFSPPRPPGGFSRASERRRGVGRGVD